MDDELTFSAAEQHFYWQNRFIQATGLFLFAFFFLGWDFLIAPIDSISHRSVLGLAFGAVGLVIQSYSLFRVQKENDQRKADPDFDTRYKLMAKVFRRRLLPSMLLGTVATLLLFFYQYGPLGPGGLWGAGLLIALIVGPILGMYAVTIYYLAIARPPAIHSAADLPAAEEEPSVG